MVGRGGGGVNLHESQIYIKNTNETGKITL